MKRFALCLSALVALGLSAAAGQSSDAPRQRRTFQSGVSLVAVNVTVIGPDRRFVTDLAASDFVVYEDGVPQQIRFFESSAIPIDLIILLDASSSMRHQLDVVHRAAVGFVEKLRPGDRGAIVTFSDKINMTQGLTEDRAALEHAIRKTRAYGGTALYNALYIALKEFGQAAMHDGEQRRQAVAVLSDGTDTASLVGFDDVIRVARRSGVNVYPIALDVQDAAVAVQLDTWDSDQELRQLAQETGAQAFFPKTVSELSAIYDAIATELSNQYSIGYAPANSDEDGGFRRIVVRVTSRPDLWPRARTGYVAARGSRMSIGHGR